MCERSYVKHVHKSVLSDHARDWLVWARRIPIGAECMALCGHAFTYLAANPDLFEFFR